MNLGELYRRIVYLLNRRRIEAELEREMQTHREMLAEMPGEQPRFGNALKLREDSRDVWGWTWLDTGLQDVRYAFRTMTPGFLLSAALILSFGIGLNVTFFQIVNVALLKPLSVRDPDQLVNLQRRSKDNHSNRVPYAAAEFVRANNHVFSAVLTRTHNNLAFGDDASDLVRVAFVSANWFAELGYGPFRGRVLVREVDGQPHAPPAVVISHEMWTGRYHADPAVVGRSVRLNNRAATIVGVARPEFPDLRTLDDPQIWAPITQIDYFLPGSDLKTAWTSDNIDFYGRLRPGITLDTARESLKVIAAEITRQHPEAWETGTYFEPYSGTRHFRTPAEQQQTWTIVALLACLTMLVLFVACSNLSNLVLSRAMTRIREFSIRVALGASRWRILRQVLIEAFVLACVGTAGGMLAGASAVRLFAATTDMPSYVSLSPDAPTAAAALGLALVTMLVVGFLPAWRVSRQDLSTTMKDGGQQASGSMERARLRKLLITAQVAGSCVLLVVAGLMVRGLQRLLLADPGFEFAQVAVLDPELSRTGINGAEARRWWAQVRARIAANPEAAGVAIASHAPVGSSVSESAYPDAANLIVTNMEVDSEFLQLMKIPIVAGRNFVPSDDHRTSIIVSRRLAERMYGSIDVVGKGFPKSKSSKTIVGVAADARIVRMQARNAAEQYSPLNPESYAHYVLVARARQDPARLIAPLRLAARTADDRVLGSPTLLRDEFQKKLRAPRLASLIGLSAGLLALLLACVGIYGVTSFNASLRTKEMGIRMALGSSPSHLMRMLLRQQAWPLLLGALLGMAGAIPIAIVLQREPFFLDSADPLAYAGVLALLAICGGVANLVPAWRAVRADAVSALRYE
ncbi:MAG TPA: ADOP family duplicated permease [Bryobacteraceae bacterium]|nr:ADOP family duplicated permease [Bryobacteraceae bacterium]